MASPQLALSPNTVTLKAATGKAGRHQAAGQLHPAAGCPERDRLPEHLANC